jgi:D-tyrosyl-tRNA(Tyr) deacylase
VRALVQRVTEARVRVDGEVIGEIGPGLCVLVGATHDDGVSVAGRLAEKVWNLRIFKDQEGKMNRSLAEVGGDVVVVPQFTLYGDTSGGRRPSWIRAAPPDVANGRIESFAAALSALGASVSLGAFGEHMEVELVNDGPVTLQLEA